MVEQRVMCDRCGNVILEGRSLLTVEAGPLRTRRESVDLCSDCADLLAGWLSPESAAPEPFIPPIRQGISKDG